MPSHRLRPLSTTLIGGLVFLLPMIVVLVVVGHAMQIAVQAVTPLVQYLPGAQAGGIALVTAAAVLLLLALCYSAGVVARGAFARSLSARFEEKLTTVYPRYQVIKAMSQNLHGAVGQQVLKPVLLCLGDQQQFAYDIERLADGRAVVFVPGAPDAWSGSVLLVEASRLQALAVDPAAVARSLQSMGHGLAGLLDRAA
jgi:uncharacterized membrane protein